MEFYHIVNRGVEGRDIVLDDRDRWRFIHSLFVFNDRKDVDPNHRDKHWLKEADTRELLVHIHAFCLMNNHYHLLLSPLCDDGIARFMKKLNMGHAKYYNERYHRHGLLWQGKYRKMPVVRDAHFLYVPFYIHCNPLDYTMPEWRDGRVQDVATALHTLESYKWSSHLDYIGIKNVPSILYSTTLRQTLGSVTDYQKELRTVLQGGINLGPARSHVFYE